MATDYSPKRVFEDVSADIFAYKNKYYLVYVDRLSGWSTLTAWARHPTAKDLVQVVAKNFVDLGVPVRFRSDGGRQFTSREFRSFLKNWGVEPVTSSPHYPQSNGHAEAAVKAMKRLVIKTAPNGNIDSEEFRHALLEWRNTPKEHGLSPAQIVFGHPLRSLIPAHYRSFSPEWQKAMDEVDKATQNQRADAAERYNLRSKALTPLSVGDTVRIQDPITKLWDQTATVVGVGKHRDYRTKTASGRVSWRNRRFIRKMR